MFYIVKLIFNSGKYKYIKLEAVDYQDLQSYVKKELKKQKVSFVNLKGNLKTYNSKDINNFFVYERVWK